MKIIFRGMTESGVWFCGDLLTDYSSNSKHTIRYDNTIYKDVIPETVGQCTGLKDVNGDYIYVGDIVRVNFSNIHKPLGKVIFAEQIAKFGIKLTDNNFFDFKVLLAKRDCEIIGNIHDNPELLEVEL